MISSPNVPTLLPVVNSGSNPTGGPFIAANQVNINYYGPIAAAGPLRPVAPPLVPHSVPPETLPQIPPQVIQQIPAVNVPPQVSPMTSIQPIAPPNSSIIPIDSSSSSSMPNFNSDNSINRTLQTPDTFDRNIPLNFKDSHSQDSIKTIQVLGASPHKKIRKIENLNIDVATAQHLQPEKIVSPTNQTINSSLQSLAHASKQEQNKKRSRSDSKTLVAYESSSEEDTQQHDSERKVEVVAKKSSGKESRFAGGLESLGNLMGGAVPGSSQPNKKARKLLDTFRFSNQAQIDAATLVTRMVKHEPQGFEMTNLDNCYVVHWGLGHLG